ncbi:hypothetical protein [Microtetraspora malaysiensis]|uniref:hypothetical protein n=1 Tax=Microtetraspora malaysiensis TaxID=161358 RepID=UPI003D8BED0C
MRPMLIRLRPVVHATPTPTGLHVRGWTSSFTVGGGAGLWRLWERLSVLLADGVPAAELTTPDGLPEPVAKALELIIAQLREHDMLVEVPPGWGQPGPGLPSARVAAWLESAATDPAAAWDRLSGASYTVHGHGPLAETALRALAAAGVNPPVVRGEPVSTSAGGGLELTAVPVGGVPVTVMAGCLGEVGYAVAPGPSAEVAAEAMGVRQRLLLGADGLLAAQADGGPHQASPAPVGPYEGSLASAGMPGEPPEVLCALVGGVAVHRLLCAVAGMPDPVEEAAARTPEGVEVGRSLSVMVARVEPLGVTHHRWPSGNHPADPWERVADMLEVLGDPELGMVPPPEAGELPQVPVSLVACGQAMGFGTTLESARLHAALSAVGSALPAGTVVGADPLHARGLGLREAVHRDLADLPRTPMDEEVWAADPAARRWWKALTLRFAVPAAVEVVGLPGESRMPGSARQAVLSPGPWSPTRARRRLSPCSRPRRGLRRGRRGGNSAIRWCPAGPPRSGCRRRSRPCRGRPASGSGPQGRGTARSGSRRPWTR